MLVLTRTHIEASTVQNGLRKLPNLHIAPLHIQCQSLHKRTMLTETKCGTHSPLHSTKEDRPGGLSTDINRGACQPRARIRQCGACRRYANQPAIVPPPQARHHTLKSSSLPVLLFSCLHTVAQLKPKPMVSDSKYLKLLLSDKT